MKPFLFAFLGFLLSGLLLLGLSFFLPWSGIDWGALSLKPARTVTVVGEAKSKLKSEIASFSAGVNAINDDKEKAVTEVNSKVNAIIESVKSFGIKSADVKTQNLNIYQNQESYYEDNRQKQRPGQWSVSNSVEIKLHDVDRAQALADLLAKSGANNVYGPNFALDEDSTASDALFTDAVENAKTKAANVARAAGRKLGAILSVTEGVSATGPITLLRMEGGGGGGGGGGGLEPGTGTISKSVTVIFELR
ncbi:MAG: SIMPL domain-containing protein [Candidatus Gottesmanbacteria bacterium]|nr:SIMPL domain-containing protein [Candidatus Gottesmanbacteria bacterium]